MALVTGNMKLPSGLSVPGSSFTHSDLLQCTRPCAKQQGCTRGKQAGFLLASSFQANGKTHESNNPTKEGIIKQ